MGDAIQTISEQSAHYNMHKAIQRTFDPKLTDQENVELAVKYVVKDDRRGYISCPIMEAEILSAVKSFRPFANEWQLDLALQPNRQWK